MVKSIKCVYFNFVGRDRAVRYLKATWAEDMAFFDLQSAYSSINLDRDMQGTIKMEVPLTTRHIANIEYGLKERALLSTGHCVINYNSKKVLNGQYTCKSEFSASFDKDEITILLENDLKPIGIFYVHATKGNAVDMQIYVSLRLQNFINNFINFILLIRTGHETSRNLRATQK